MIAIIDYGLGNLTSVKNALEKVGACALITRNKSLIRGAKGVVLPGVGAAKIGMDNLHQLGLDIIILEMIQRKRPILGICLGMQLLLTMSDEGNARCLNVIEGAVRKFSTEMKVPQIGWNQVTQRPSRLFADIPDQSYFYFVHSYYCKPEKTEMEIGITHYSIPFCSAIEQENTFGVQFHPEKSGKNGLQLLRNFVDITYANNSSN